MFEALTETLTPQEVRDITEIFRQEALQDALQAEQEMALIGAANAQAHRSIEGLGQMTARFHPMHYWTSLVTNGASHLDPEFKTWLAKRPESDYAHVRSNGTKIQVGYTGERRVRFHKRYGEG